MTWLLSFVCVIGLASIEDAKQLLFSAWNNSSQISMVSIGLPTAEERVQVDSFLNEVNAAVLQATATQLTTDERAFDVPFLLAMLDGIDMQSDEHIAARCVAQLEAVGEVAFGISASRMWRMRLQAAMVLGNDIDAQHAAQQLHALQNVDIEDQTVAVLFDIHTAFALESQLGIDQAMRLFVSHDGLLTNEGRHYLREPFICGVAKCAPTPRIAIEFFLRRAAMHRAEGFAPAETRAFLETLINRLPTTPVLSTADVDARIASIALWREIDVQEQSTIEQVADLQKLASFNDVEAAQMLIHSFSSHPAVRPSMEELFLLASASTVNSEREYWQLQHAMHDIQQRQFDNAELLLNSIPTDSMYAAEVAALRLQLKQLDVQSLLIQVKRAVQSNNSVEAIIHDCHDAAVQQIAWQVIKVSHQGREAWVNPTIHAILSSESKQQPSVSAELHRMVGQKKLAAKLFTLAIQKNGETVEYLAGLADCTHDGELMKRVAKSTSPQDTNPYWYWLANLRLLEWHLEQGGSHVAVIARVNRLRKKDASLGGVLFQSEFNALCEKLD